MYRSYGQASNGQVVFNLSILILFQFNTVLIFFSFFIYFYFSFLRPEIQSCGGFNTLNQRLAGEILQHKDLPAYIVELKSIYKVR